jgi:2-succinyl-6-hydroxy-2,4-cyclohexadiene-1-carboxylate synthase
LARIALDSLQGQFLNVERSGSGPPILAIHGFTGSLSTWDAFSKAVQAEYSIIKVDMPGHGLSDSPDNSELYSMENTAKALAELLDKLNIQRVHWLGYSMGARIALGASILLKERTLSLILESGSPGLATLGEQAARVKNDEALAKKIETEGLESFINYWEALPMWASQSRLPQTVRNRLRAQRLSNNPTGLVNSLRGIGTGAQPSFHERLAEIRVPTIFITGEEDEKFVNTAKEMQRSVKNSRLRIVKESGHTVHLEQSDEFNRIVLDFLRNVKSPDTKEAEVRNQPSL